MSDKNAFANSDLITLAELLLQVQNNNDLSFSRRREIASALRALATWTQIPLAMMPASATYLRERFDRIHHDNIGGHQAPSSECPFADHGSLPSPRAEYSASRLYGDHE